jgi:hypothetical protein
VPKGKLKKQTPREIDLASLARAYTTGMVSRLGNYALNDKLEIDDELRLRAIGMLLDRGWGRPNQPHDANLSGELRITIRKMLGDKGDDE